MGPDFPTSPRSASHDSVYASPLVTGLPLKKEKTEVCFNVPLISRIKWQPDFQFFKLTIILSSFYKINKRSHSKMLFVNRKTRLPRFLSKPWNRNSSNNMILSKTRYFYVYFMSAVVCYYRTWVWWLSHVCLCRMKARNK